MLTGLALAALLVTAPVAVPTTGLVVCYPLDGDAAEANGGKPGRVTRAVPTDDRFGAPKGALRFNGVDSEVVIDPPAALTDGGLTVSVWVRSEPTEPPSVWVDVTDGDGKFIQPIAGQDDGYSLRSWQLWMTADGKLVWHRVGEFSSAWTKQRVETGRWYHVAATYAAGKHKLYVDGQLVMAADGIYKATHDQPLQLGSKGGAGTKRAWFSGSLDELRIYGRALDEAEIMALFTEPAG